MDLLEGCVANQLPKPIAAVDRHQLAQQSTLAMPDDDHLLQGRVFVIGIEFIECLFQSASQDASRIDTVN